MKQLVITIDGPAGAGKTTVSKILAQGLGYKYVDTGALYRGVALEAKSAGLSMDDDAGLDRLCKGIKLKFVNGKKGQLFFLNELDITDRIRSPEISMMASAVSARPVVRKFLLDVQRGMGKKGGAVFEGRDMGTVVFPNAHVKFFLDASIKTRALRRYEEIKSTSSQSLEDVKKDMENRDINDSARALAPLKPADDAIKINSTDFGVDDVVKLMLAEVKKNRY